MPNVPGVDLPASTANWTEQQRNLYNKLDFYLVKNQLEWFKQKLLWQKLLKPIKWKANSGPVMRSVTKVPSPHQRSKFFPNALSEVPKKDVLQVLEVAEEAKLYRHYFDSLVFQFLPSFEDFLTDHVEAHNKDITEKIIRSHDLFIRTAIFEAAPHIWVCGHGSPLKTSVPYTTGANITESKTSSFISSLLQESVDSLSLREISKIASALEYDIGAPPFSGTNLGDGTDGQGLNGKYCLVTSTEVWHNFAFDPYLVENRQLNLDIVTSGFVGSLFGRITTKFEQYPLRFNSNGEAPAPETYIGDTNSPMYGMTVPNPDYVAAPFEVAWLLGAESFKSISVGPPPAAFASGTMSYDRFQAMDWSGKVQSTRNILVPVVDSSTGETVYEPNTRGEYMKLIATAVYGIIPVNRRNVLPILFKRQRGGASL